MADFDEELRRQAAISSLLAQQPESQPLDTQTDEQVVAQPEVIKPDTQEDYHKLINQAFPTVAEDQPEGPPKLAPTPIVPGLLTDPESGSRYVKDPSVESGVVPYAEPATPADEAAFKPGDVTLPKSEVLGPAPRAQLVDPDPDQNYFELNQADKPIPGFVPGSKNAIVNPAAGVTPPTPKPAYPDQIVTPEEAAGTKSVVNAPAASAATAVATPTPTDQAQVTQPASNDDYNKLMDSFFPSAQTQTKAEVGTGDMPPMLNAPNGQAPAALIIHHTSGNNSAQSVVDDWRTNRPGVGAQMIMDRDGTVHYTQKEFGYNGTGNFLHSVIPGVSNQTAVGIEVIAKDDADMTPAQLQSLQRLAGPKGPYANVPVYGHSQVSPSDRENEGVRGVNAINEARSGAAPTGEPGTTPIETLVKLDQSGLNVTHFGYEKPGEEGWDKDSANGNGKYVKDLIPGYDVALNSASAALVGNPKPGETFQYAGREWRYGDAVSEKLTDPRFDIFDPTGNALSGQLPVGKQVAASASAQNKMPWDDWTPLSPADQAAAEKEGQDFRTQQTSVLDKLNRSTPNPKQFWDKLQQPIEGVTDSQRQAYADNFKQEVTKYAQDFYGEKDPEKAFSRAVSDPGLEAYVSNIGRGLAGAVGQADIGIALAGKSIDRNRVDGFMNLVHPDSTGEGRAGFVKALTDIQDKNQRHDVFNEIYGALPQNTKDAIGDPASILDSIDNLANPARQADLNKAIATKKAWVDQQLAGDPQLRGTGADWWTTGTGENLFNTVAALVPGGVGAVVRTSTLGAQMYSANMDRIAQEHPDWSGERVSEEASKSAFMTLAPSEAVLAASHGLTAPLLKWAGSLAEKPIVRFGIGGGVQVGAAAVGGAAGQVGSNIAENKPLLQDVPQAAGSAIVQSLPFVVHGGLHGVAEGPPVKPEVQEPVPTTHLAPEPAAAEPAPTPETPTTPVSRSSILGPEETGTPPVGERWYDPGPITTRPIERTAFSPQELSQAVSRLSDAGMSPDQIHQVISQLQPGYEQGVQSVRLGAEGDLEAARTQQIQANRTGVVTPDLPSQAHAQVYRDLVASGMSDTRARNFVSRAKGTSPADILMDVQTQMREGGYRPVQKPQAPVDLAEAIRQQKAVAGLGGAPAPQESTARPLGGAPGGPSREPPTRISESEPFVSKVANRYTAERMATGELGQVDPSQGKSTEELVRQGIQMTPNQREGLIDNFVKGKGGDLDQQGAAIRSKEAILSVQSSEASRASEADPTNRQLKADADAALKAATDFHNGPVKKFKRVWSDSGRGLQREIPLDYSTLNGMKEAYTKGAGNGKEAPPEMEPALKQMSKRVNESASKEEAAVKNAGDAIGNEVAKKARRKTLPTNDQIRTRLMEIMNDLPCRN